MSGPELKPCPFCGGAAERLTLPDDEFGNGIALTPDRTSAPWWQDAAQRADAILPRVSKIKFERPDGTVGASPGSGVTLWAAGERADAALCRAAFAGLGTVWHPYLAARKTA